MGHIASCDECRNCNTIVGPQCQIGFTVGALPGGLDIMSLVVDYGYLQDTNTSLLSLSLIFCEPDLLYTMPLETVSTIPQSFQFLFNKLKL